MALSSSDPQSVAITGLSCRFPGDGDNLENFWNSICEGKSAWSKIPRERFNVDAFWSPTKNRNTMVTQGAHFLKQDVATFDANFFSISKAEVEAMDPQHRIMIEVVYEALDKAGLTFGDLTGTRTGVFMGHFTSDYKEMLYRDPDTAPSYTATGASKTSLANRISWLLDLVGPSFTLDTACSSSLVALHVACQSLRTGESDIAIVGGSSLLLSPEMFMYLSNQNFLSPDGKCKSFDQSADGYGRGEGFACMVLKRVDEAISSGDPIRAVIRGTGSNQDGHTKGLTLPSADAQAALIESTYRNAGLDFQSTYYVETHGTGTQAGDVEETEGLSRTIAAAHSPTQKLIVGSVKSNIGHLEAAAGLAGVVKAVLMLENGIIPPSINFKNGNPKIKFDEWNIQVATSLTPWPVQGLRRVSTNSFGYGGTNAHAILDDAYHYLEARGLSGNHYTQVSPPMEGIDGTLKANGIAKIYGYPMREGPRLFVLSAQDKEGLKRLKPPLSQYLDGKDVALGHEAKEQETLLGSLAYTLSERKSRLQWKTYAIASSTDELSQALKDPENAALVSQSSRSPRLGFVFTGQGAQFPRMGAELMAYKEFSDSVLLADNFLREECECLWSAAEELRKGKSISQLHLAAYSQTLCTVLQVALVDLLRTWNISPVAVAGHSSGEIAAAYCMGALSREDAWRIAYYRGILSSGMKVTASDIEGSMMAVGVSPEQADEWISKATEGEAVVACVNSPSSVTISGDTAGIDQLLGLLKEEGIFARKLLVDTAYHSPHMQMVAQDYYDAIADITPLEPEGSCKMHSSVTGSLIDASELGPVNWVRNLTSPVQFASAIHDMLRPMQGGMRATENSIDILVEIGPHSALQGPATQTLKAHGITNIPYHSALVRNQNAITTALELAGALYAQGVQVNISQVNNDANTTVPKPLIDLPLYPWKHNQRYWHESRIEKEYRFRKHPKLSLLGAPSPSFGEGEHLWRGFIRLSEEPWISDHKIQGSILYPGAGFLAMALEAASQIADENQRVASYRLRDVQLTSAVVINEGVDLECIVQLRPHHTGTRSSGSTWTEFVITSSADGENLQRNCSGLLIVEYEPIEDSDLLRERAFEDQVSREKYLDASQQCKNTIPPADFYSDLTAIGLIYGPSFANLTSISNSEGQSHCVVQIPAIPTQNRPDHSRPHIIHPGTLDAIFHLAFAAVKDGKDKLTSAMVPRSIDEVVIAQRIPFEAGSNLIGFSNAKKHGFREVIADITMLDESATKPMVQISGFRCAEIAGASTSATETTTAKAICSKLTWRPAVDLLTSKELRNILERKSAASEHGLNATTARLSAFVDLHHHSTPGLSILEVNVAREQKDARPLIPEFQNLDAILKTGSYTVIRQNELDMVGMKEKMAAIDSKIAVELFDIERDISTQSLKDRSFDLVVVSGLSGSAIDLDLVANNLKKLLKDGGQVCIIGAQPSLLENFQNPLGANCINTNLVLQDFDIAESPQINFIIASKDAASEVTRQEKEITLIEAANQSKAARIITDELAVALEKLSYRTHRFVWGSDVSGLKDKHCVALMELEESLLEDLSKQDFDSVKRFILDAASIFWAVGFDDPSSAMVDGLARTVRNEAPGMSFRTFRAEAKAFSCLGHLGDLINRTFHSSTADDEFRIIDGLVHVSRAEEDTVLNEEMNSLLPEAGKKIVKMPARQVPYSLKLCVQTPGMLDSLSFEADDVPETELEDNKIEIQVKATALNFREVMVVMGQIPDSALGFDASGVVRRIGSAVTKFKIGDKVAMYGHGAHRTIHRSRADFCEVIPDGMSFEQAASIPGVHGTAYYGLVRLARVEAGQSILIHAAAGGVGQAAIQIAKHFKMEIFATVSSETKRKLLRDNYGIPDDHIFNSRDFSFVKGVKRMTDGRGVDVVLNSLSGEALRQTWYCIAPFGYFLEIGIKDILGNTELDMRPFLQDATFSFFNLNHIETSRPDIMASIVAGVFDFQRRGITRPVTPLVIYPLSEIENAFRLMQTGKHVGKIAITWSDDQIVPVVQRNASSLKLDPDAAYMLVGGLGGLGRSLSTMLVDRGARKLCFLSRSGSTSTQARKLITDLEEQKVQVEAYKCDVADESAVAEAVSKCESSLGRIRGVFQCAMVLRDTLFTNMDYQQWIESTRPKVQGSWNLHQQLKDVDFFIVLSSFAAIFGNRGQSNYAAAGAYEDALAHYRRAQGQHAVTLDLGIMRDIGVLAETGITESLREWEEPYGIRATEFHTLIEKAIAGDIAGSISPQILTGLATGGSAIAAGITTPFYLDDPRFSILAHTGVREQSGSVSSGDSLPVQTLISQAKSLPEAAEYVQEALVKRVAKMLQTSTTEIDTGRFLHSYGIDSLVAIEIVNWALKEIKASITVFDVLAGIPITATATKIATRSGLLPKELVQV